MLSQANWGRPVAITAAIVFAISWVFPLSAGLSRDTSKFSLWWGRLDVGVAFVLVILTFLISGYFQKEVSRGIEDRTYRVYRIVLHGLLALVVFFIYFGDTIVWVNCITGFGWRTWLFLYGLPAWLAAFHSGDRQREPTQSRAAIL